MNVSQKVWFKGLRVLDSQLNIMVVLLYCSGLIGREYERLEITSPLSSFLLDQHSRRLGGFQPNPPLTLIIYLIDVQNTLLTRDEHNL